MNIFSVPKDTKPQKRRMYLSCIYYVHKCSKLNEETSALNWKGFGFNYIVLFSFSKLRKFIIQLSCEYYFSLSLY